MKSTGDILSLSSYYDIKEFSKYNAMYFFIFFKTNIFFVNHEFVFKFVLSIYAKI